MLPHRLRMVQLIDFIRSLVWQVPDAGNRFDLFVSDAYVRANLTAGKLALQKAIYHEIDAIADIEGLDGKPFDFLVKVYGPVDENRLRDVINRHKLAGKSYTFELGAVTYNATFGNYVCESIDETFDATFSDFYCETNDHVYLWFSGLTVLTSTSVRITVQSTEQPTSDLTITGNLMGTDIYGNDHLVKENFSVTLLTGNDIANSNETTNDVTGLTLWVDLASVVITPNSDATYSYYLIPEE